MSLRKRLAIAIGLFGLAVMASGLIRYLTTPGERTDCTLASSWGACARRGLARRTEPNRCRSYRRWPGGRSRHALVRLRSVQRPLRQFRRWLGRGAQVDCADPGTRNRICDLPSRKYQSCGAMIGKSSDAYRRARAEWRESHTEARRHRGRKQMGSSVPPCLCARFVRAHRIARRCVRRRSPLRVVVPGDLRWVAQVLATWATSRITIHEVHRHTTHTYKSYVTLILLSGR